MVGLGSPQPPGADSPLWIPGWVLGTVMFTPGVGSVRATLTFLNSDIYRGGVVPALLVNFSGNVSLSRPTTSAGGPAPCVLGDSVLGLPHVPPGVVTVLSFVPSFAPTATATHTATGSSTATGTSTSTSSLTSSSTATHTASSSRSVTSSVSRTPSETPSHSPPSASATPPPHAWGTAELAQVMAARALRSTILIASADVLAAPTPAILPPLPSYLEAARAHDWVASDVALAQAAWVAGGVDPCNAAPPWNGTLTSVGLDWNGTLAFSTDVSGSVGLLADLWLVDEDGEGGCGSARQRAVPLSSTTLWLPYSASRGADLPRGDQRSGLAALQSLEPSPTPGTPPTGIILSVTSAQWAFVGCHLASLGGEATASQPCSPASAHVVTMHSSSIALALNRPVWAAAGGGAGGTYEPLGTAALLAGYVYVISVTVNVSTFFSWGTSPLGAAAYLYGGPADDATAAAPVTNEDLPSIELSALAMHSPIFCTRSPPMGGTIAVSPVNGTALSTIVSGLCQEAAGSLSNPRTHTHPHPLFNDPQFSVSTTGWVDTGAPAGLLPPPPSLMASWLATTLPLPKRAVVVVSAALRALARSSTYANSSNAPTAAFVVNNSCPFEVNLNSTSAAVALETPLYFLQLSALAATLRYSSSDALCTAASSAASSAASRLSVDDAAAPSSLAHTLIFQFRILSSDSPLPAFMPAADVFGRGMVADALSHQSALRSVALWPGVPLAPTSTAAALNTTFALGRGGGGPVTIVLFAVDASAAIGVAYATVLLEPLSLLSSVSSSSVVNASAAAATVAAVSLFVQNAAAALSPTAAAENPFAAVLTAGALAGLLSNGSSSAALATGEFNASSLAALARGNTGARDALLASIDAAVSALAGAGGTASDGSMGLGGNLTALTSAVRVDDGTVEAATGTLLSLTAEPAELSPASRLVATAALRALLLAALPVSASLASEGSTAGTGGAVLDANSSAVLVATSTAPGLPAFSATTGAVALGVITNILSAALQAPAAFGSGIVVAAPPGGGIDADVAAGLGSALAALSAATLRAAAPADAAQTLSAGPPAAFLIQGSAENESSSSFCGAAVVLSASRVDVRSGSGASLSIGRPLLSCRSAVASSSGATFPLSPAPAVWLSNETLWAAATDAGTGAAASPSIDVVVVQWGVSPFPSSPGWEDVPGAPNWRAGELGNASAHSLVAAVVGAGLSSSTEPGTQRDALPGRVSGGSDTRTLAVSLQTRAAVPLPVVNVSGAPIRVTLPLADPGVAAEAVVGQQRRSSLTLSAAGESAPLALLLTCPTQAQMGSGEVAPGTRLPLALVTSSADNVAIPASPLNATVVQVMSVRFAIEVGDAVAPDTASRLPFAVGGGRSLAGGAAFNAQLSVGIDSHLAPRRGLGEGSGVLSESPVQWFDGPLTDAAPGSIVNVTAWVAVVGVFCGAPAGMQRVVCGPGHEGVATAYTCPTIALFPTCAAWSTEVGAWNAAGCVAVAATPASITCACRHLTDFSARFAAFGEAQNDIFADASLLRSPAVLEQYPHVFIALGTILGGFALLLAVGACADAAGARKFYRGLASDPEVRLLARLIALREERFVLDRVIDASGGGAHGSFELSLEEGVAVVSRAASLASAGAAQSSTYVASRTVVPQVVSAGSATSSRSIDGGDATVVHVAVPAEGTVPGATDPVDDEGKSGPAPDACTGQERHVSAFGMGATPGMSNSDLRTHELSASGVAALAEVAAAHPFSSADPYSTAIYLRTLERFDGASVTATRALADPRLACAAERLGPAASAVLEDASRDEGSTAWAAARVQSRLSELRSLISSSKLGAPLPPPSHRYCMCCPVRSSESALRAAASTEESRMAILLDRVETASASLDGLSQWTCSRAWNLKRFLLQVSTGSAGPML